MLKKSKQEIKELVKEEDSDNEKTPKKKRISQLEFEKKIKELAKKGLTSEKIGEELKKQGIHPKEYNKKISKILEKEYSNPDLKNVQIKLEKIKKHYEKNKQDKRAMRERERIFAQLRKIKKYLGIK